MKSGYQLKPEDRPFLGNVYTVIDEVASRCRMANIPMGVEACESSRAFHEVLERVESAGIKPVDFIAVHALGRTAEMIAGFRREEERSRLTALLFEKTEQFIDPTMRRNAEAWAKSEDIEDPAELASSDNWTKLAIITEMMRELSLLIDNPGLEAYATETADRLSPMINACKGLSPQIDSYVQSRLIAAGHIASTAQAKHLWTQAP